MTDFADPVFRWRAGLLDMDFLRTPVSMGVTLLDFNYRDRIESEIRWVNLRVGPALYLGNSKTYFSLRAIAQGGLTTSQFGTFAYTGLAPSAELNRRKRSYEVGYAGEAELFLFSRISLKASFSHRHLLGGIRPQLYHAMLIAGFRVSPSTSIITSYELEEARAASSKLQQNGLHLGLAFLL